MYRFLTGVFAITLIMSADTAPNNGAGAAGANASQPVASVSGSGPFSINGASLAAGIPSWPVMAGDQIASGSTPVEITLPDGTQLDLSPQSKVTIKIQNGIVEVIVIAGDCRPRDPHAPPHYCWASLRPEPTSHHRCGGGGRYYDAEAGDYCCPGS